MMRTRTVVIALIGMVMAVLLAACSDSATTTPQTDQAVATQVAQGVQATLAAQTQPTSAPTSTNDAAATPIVATSIPGQPTVTPLPATATNAPNVTAPDTATPAPSTAVPATNTPIPPTATKAPTPTAKPKDGIRLSQAQWREVIKNTPDAHAYDKNGVLHVSVYTLPIGNWTVDGTPRVDSILYTNLDDKAGDEAIVPVLADDKKGDSGFIVYTGGISGPRYLTWQHGWQLKLSIANNRLMSVEQDCTPYGFDPVGIRQTSYNIKGDSLNADELLLCPIDSAQKAVEIYLKARNVNLGIAYALLSPAYQKANPFEKWVKQYDGIRDVKLVTFRPTTTPNTVFLTFSQTEADGSTHSYTGTWKVTRNAERNNWQMADPAFQLGSE